MGGGAAAEEGAQFEKGNAAQASGQQTDRQLLINKRRT